MASDIELLHYAVAKGLSEVKAHKLHIKELEKLVLCLQNTEEAQAKLSELRTKYSKQETVPCSDLSKLPPTT